MRSGLARTWEVEGAGLCDGGFELFQRHDGEDAEGAFEVWRVDGEVGVDEEFVVDGLEGCAALAQAGEDFCGRDCVAGLGGCREDVQADARGGVDVVLLHLVRPD